MTQDSNFNSRVGNYGPSFDDWRWSQFMTDYNIGGDDGPDTGGISRTYEWSVYFNNYGKQKFYAVADDDAFVYINGVYQFDTGWMGHQTSKTTPGYFAPGVYTVKVTTVNSGTGPWGVALQWYGFEAPPIPTVTYFSATPNPQNSSNGTPQYSTALVYSSSGLGITSAHVASSIGETWVVGSSGTLGIGNLPQSNANGTSPAQRTYSFKVCNNRGCSPWSSVTVSAYNDNTPSNGWTTSFTNLEPNTQYTVTVGTLSGVDMPTTISTSGSSNYVGNGGSFSGSRSFTNGQTVQLRTTTLPFNTSMSGVGANATYGNTNSKTVTISHPGGSFNVACTTKAPVVKEIFNYADNKDKYPHEDIDLITNNPLEFTTSAQIDVDDIEIAQEIKVDDPDAQVSINNGTWQNVREI